MDTFTSYMDTFEGLLAKGSNNFDVMVKKVETVKGGFSMEDANAETIYNFWDQYPNPNNFVLSGDAIVNAVYDWNGFPAGGRRPSGEFNHIFVESESYDVSDFEISSTYAWHGCCAPSGYIFRFNPKDDTGYLLIIGRTLQLYRATSLQSNGFLGSVGDKGNASWAVHYDECPNLVLLKSVPCPNSTSGRGLNFKLKVTNNNIEVSSGETNLLTYFDPNMPDSGGVGLFAGCCVLFRDVTLAYDKTEKMSLGEAIQDVAWRDESIRFVVHATDTHPLEFDPENSNRQTDFEYTVAKLLAANCYLINLGTSTNRSDMRTLIEAIQPATPLYTSLEITNLKNIASVESLDDIKDKGIYLDNSPISEAMINSSNYITEVAKKFIKPSDWILVGTQLTWDTEYKDGSMNNGKPAGEGDYALNYGEHNGKNIPSSKKQSHDNWDATHDTFGKQLPSTLSITNEFRGEKILAERWRYRHYYTYFDNPTIQEPYHNQWIPDPEEVFNNPGKFRINYKRLDNPLYQLDNPNRRDTSLTHLFAEYRRWSDNYDKEGYNTTPNMIPIENKN